jgi:hypothetical protein
MASHDDNLRPIEPKPRSSRRKLTMRDAQDDFGLRDPQARADVQSNSPCRMGKREKHAEDSRDENSGGTH